MAKITNAEIVARHNAACEALGISSRLAYAKGWFTHSVNLQTPTVGHMSNGIRRDTALKELGRREAQLVARRQAEATEAPHITVERHGAITFPVQTPAPAFNRHKVALDVQDAGNLRALAREFVRVVDDAMEETKSTEATWADAAVRLFVNKFESLCRSESTFSDAYRVCKERAQ